MKIGLIALGTRGDVQPVLAFAHGLQQAGCHPCVIAGSNFADWVRSQGLMFADIGVDMQQMMASPAGVRWVESHPMRQMPHMRRLFRSTAPAIQAGLLRATASVDALMGTFTSDCFGMAIAEQRHLPYVRYLLQPLRATRAGSATLIAPRPASNSRLNFWFGKLAERLINDVFHDDMNRFRAELGLPLQTRQAFMQRWHRLPVVHAFSPQVVPKPVEWPESHYIAGYWFLDEATPTPSTRTAEELAALAQFIGAGSRPVYIGFGSSTASNPRTAAQVIFDAVQQANMRAVVAQGWRESSDIAIPKSIFVVKSVAHSWLFPQMAGVVHHGGAGTTAAGLRAGVPSFIVPHFAEQPFWGRRLYELGVGVKPVPRNRITAENLAAGIHQLVHDDALRQRAARFGATLRAENGVGNAVAWVRKHLAW
jgi:UDP:flavonoid glycosyltransferase YjiC (YdhE family)